MGVLKVFHAFYRVEFVKPRYLHDIFSKLSHQQVHKKQIQNTLTMCYSAETCNTVTVILQLIHQQLLHMQVVGSSKLRRTLSFGVFNLPSFQRLYQRQALSQALGKSLQPCWQLNKHLAYTLKETNHKRGKVYQGKLFFSILFDTLMSLSTPLRLLLGECTVYIKQINLHPNKKL